MSKEENAVEYGERSHSKNHLRLSRCYQLLDGLNPDRPPATVRRKEFRWQYRALLERVQLYSERLAAAENPVDSPDPALQRAEFAIELSLRYFHDVLTPKVEPGDEPAETSE